MEKKISSKPKILAADVWAMMDRVIKTLGALLLLCRLADGQKPVMSKLYGTQLYVRKSIESVAEESAVGSVELKILVVFLARWKEIQSDIIIIFGHVLN